MQQRVDLTIRQSTESLSIREGADHFLISHHSGSGIVHLGTKEQMVKDTTQIIKKKYSKELKNNAECWVSLSTGLMGEFPENYFFILWPVVLFIHAYQHFDSLI